jgi:hypothetical protein
MAMDFPNSPTVGQIFTSNGTSWEWDGTVWKIPNINELSSNGLVAKTGSGLLAARTITAGTGISISNGDGVSGNPTISATGGTGTVTSIATNNGITGGTITTTGTLGLTGQALALHNLATNGIITRTGSGTVSARTITAGTGISITNGDGVSGNPTVTATGAPSFMASSGQYFPLTYGLYSARTVTSGGNALAMPVFITSAVSVDRISIREVGGSTTNTRVVRLGLYNSSSGLPGSLVFDAGTVTYTTPGVYEITVSSSLSVGLYFLVACNVSAGVSFTLSGHKNSVLYQFASNLSTETSRTDDGITCYSGSLGTGSLPTNFGTATPAVGSADICMRIA